MKNASILLVFTLATFGLWVFAETCLLAPLLIPGTSYRVYLGLFTVLDLVKVGLFSGWAILIGRLGRVFFSGPAARPFRFAAAAFIVLLYLYHRGAFIPSNYRPEFVVQIILFAAVISAAAWYGLRSRPGKRRSP